GLGRPVAVEKGGHGKPLAEPRQPRCSVGPRRQALPGEGEFFTCRNIEACDAKVVENLVERKAVKSIEVGPRQLTPTHPIHVRDIEGAPYVRQALPVSLNATQRSESPALCSHSGTPVDGCSEDVERECADLAQVRPGQRNARPAASMAWSIAAAGSRKASPWPTASSEGSSPRRTIAVCSAVGLCHVAMAGKGNSGRSTPDTAMPPRVWNASPAMRLRSRTSRNAT